MKQFIVLALIAFVGCALVEGRAIRDLKSDLVTKGNALVKRANEDIAKLEKEHKTLEVKLIKHQEERVQKLLKELEALPANSTKLTVIEHDLAISERVLEFELRRAEHPIKSLKDLLLERAKGLEKQTEETVKKLKTEKNEKEIAVIEAELASVKKLVKELEAAKEGANLRHIETELGRAELKLAAELRKVHDEEELKEYLLKRAALLEKQAEAAIKELKAEKKDAVAAEIQKDEDLVKKLVAELNNAKPGDNLTHIEHDLSAAEFRLSLALRRAHGHDSHDIVKDILLRRADALEKRAETAIKTLKAEKKDKEAAVIEAEEKEVKRIAAELKAAKTQTDIQKLEHELAAVENKLSVELRKLQHPTHPVDPKVTTKAPAHPVEPHGTTKAVHHLARRDLKADLIAKGNELVKHTDEVVKILTNLHKTAEANAIVHEEQEVKKLIVELQSAKDTTKITHIEHDLKIAESRLMYLVRKAEHPEPHHPDHKEILLNRAKVLEKQAENVIKKLKLDHKDADVAVLEKEEALVKKLVTDIAAAKTPAEVAHLEKELQSAEYKLSYSIRKISDHEFKEELKKKSLIRRATYLEKYAEGAIKQLKAIKQDTEAASIEKEEANLKQLVKSLEAAKTETEIHAVEKQLLDVEDKLYAHLRKVVELLHPKGTTPAQHAGTTKAAHH